MCNIILNIKNYYPVENKPGFPDTYPLEVIYPVDSAIHPLNNWSLIWEVFILRAEAELHSSTYLINGVGWYNNSVDLQD